MVALWGVGTLVVIATCLWFFGFPPLTCGFRAATGYPCFSCGATRAAMALIHLRIFEALRLNPFFTFIAFVWVLFVPYALVTGFLRLPRFRVAIEGKDVYILAAIIGTAIALNWAWVLIDGR